MKNSYEFDKAQFNLNKSSASDSKNKDDNFCDRSHRGIFDRWQIVVISITIIVCAVLGALTVSEHFKRGEKSRDIEALSSKVKEYNSEADELKKVINGSGEDYDRYINEILRQRGFGQSEETWYINEDFGN